MSRPKLPNMEKKAKMNLTISPEAKEMAEAVRAVKNVSMSQLLEECIRKEYKKLQKAGDVPVPGQITMSNEGV